jgi:hypothetical protein
MTMTLDFPFLTTAYHKRMAFVLTLAAASGGTCRYKLNGLFRISFRIKLPKNARSLYIWQSRCYVMPGHRQMQTQNASLLPSRDPIPTPTLPIEKKQKV